MFPFDDVIMNMPHSMQYNTKERCTILGGVHTMKMASVHMVSIKSALQKGRHDITIIGVFWQPLRKQLATYIFSWNYGYHTAKTYGWTALFLFDYPSDNKISIIPRYRTMLRHNQLHIKIWLHKIHIHLLYEISDDSSNSDSDIVKKWTYIRMKMQSDCVFANICISRLRHWFETHHFWWTYWKLHPDLLTSSP